MNPQTQRLAAVLMLTVCLRALAAANSCLNYSVEASILQTAHSNYVEEWQQQRYVIMERRGCKIVGFKKVPVSSTCKYCQIEKASLNLGIYTEDIVEGDIKLRPGDANFYASILQKQGDSSRQRTRRNVINPHYSLSGYAIWPMGIIPYTVDTSTYSSAVSQTVSQIVRQALDSWESLTCLQFLPADDDTAAIVNHTGYVRVYSGPGCWSYIGFLDPTASQDISLAENNCLYPGVIMHEFGHAMGMVHEQARPDRESHVNILFNNIIPGYESDFYISPYPKVNVSVQYDLNSVMHYDAKAFTSDSKATVAPKYLPMVNLFGQRLNATFYDAKAVNALYQCSGSCTMPCKNDGYPRQFRDGRCQCQCPYGLGGVLCDDIDVTQFPCGGVITLQSNGAPYILTSPNYPNAYNVGVKCSWLLKAPSGFVVKIVFVSFNLSASPSQCFHYLDVRSNLVGQPAPQVYCGIGTPDTISSRFDYESSQVLIIMDASLSSAMGASGFSATVTAFKDGCLGNPCRGAPCIPGSGSSNYICQLPTENFICNFENMLSSNCSSVTTNSSFTIFSESIPQSPWQISDSNGPISAADGNYYISSVSTTAGLIASNGSFSVIPYGYNGSPRCLKFQYYLSSDSVSTLNVYVAVNGGLGDAIFSVSGYQGDTWNKVQLEINATQLSSDIIQIVMESVFPQGSADSAFIGIDDLRYFAGRCPTGPCSSDPCGAATCVVVNAGNYTCAPIGYPVRDVSCSFEDWEDCSQWLNYAITGDTLDWLSYPWRGVGTTWPRATGPRGPATGLNYLYGKLYDRSPGDKIWLRIGPFNFTSSPNRCLSYKYCMFGADEGKMTVYKSLNGLYPGTKLWSISGNRGDAWWTAAVDVSGVGIAKTAKLELTVEVTRGSSYASDYGIDDVSYTHGTCSGRI